MTYFQTNARSPLARRANPHGNRQRLRLCRPLGLDAWQTLLIFAAVATAGACGGERGHGTPATLEVAGAAGASDTMITSAPVSGGTTGTTGTTDKASSTSGGVAATGGVATTDTAVTSDMATGGVDATRGVVATGGVAPTGGGGSTSLGTGGTSPTDCPAYAPTPGASCTVTTACSYVDSGHDCGIPRTTLASCTNARWVVDLPLGCTNDFSESKCAIDGKWEIKFSGDNGGVRGTPNNTSLTISHDSNGQYYLSQTETTDFAAFDYSPESCTLQADYRYETIIPPSNGSNCGLVTTSCQLEIVFGSSTGSGTLKCTGYPNTCVGVYGGTAVLTVTATRMRT